MQRRTMIRLAGLWGLTLAPAVRAHHGWSSFDQARPLYLEGTAREVAWRNPHVELRLELATPHTLPADLPQRSVPAQQATVDAPALLKSARVPTRKDTLWQVELAPLPRLQAWGVEPIAPGERVAVLGFTFAGEQGEAVLRAEFLFRGGRAYGMRSAPA